MSIERCFVEGAPKPLGAYCHAAVLNNRLIVTAGLSARDPKTNQVPGLKLNEDGERISYDIRAETRSCLENLKMILEAAGGGLETVLEVQVFLTDMTFPRTTKSLLSILLKIRLLALRWESPRFRARLRSK